eukprot:CAMPEP_0197290424 /NCGR_PEP_ID=MMETSP0890-20130614/7637_1 /TAXON_ID=44058 ORGANISM="Aureoumbra lagunensis, Strain CCMP1510" /NCGR_SAMPLE_ID=MMETSP0890 /ASSEMBLY_ACC=CAM_ASM_000533 /LENGTH=36 /DNA_ID= /DNA_START= /DNA_END= /DNA_ORIENTATION=
MPNLFLVDDSAVSANIQALIAPLQKLQEACASSQFT